MNSMVPVRACLPTKCLISCPSTGTIQILSNVRGFVFVFFICSLAHNHLSIMEEKKSCSSLIARRSPPSPDRKREASKMVEREQSPGRRDSTPPRRLIAFSSRVGGPLSTLSNIRDRLTCAVCLELLDKPRALTCLHTFCDQCLERLMAESYTRTGFGGGFGDVAEVNCPMCRQLVRPPSGGFRDNTLVKGCSLAQPLLTINTFIIPIQI